MTRDITVEFDDGSYHQYKGAPDDATPEQVTERAEKDFAGKKVVHLDGGRKADNQPKPEVKKDEYSDEEYQAPSGLKNETAEAKRMQKQLRKANAETTGQKLKGLGEAGLTALTGLGSTAVGGLLGAGKTAYSMAQGNSADTALKEGAQTVERVQQAGTYQPRTATGQLLTNVAGTVGSVPAKGGEMGGRALGGEPGAAIGEALPAAAMALEGLRGATKAAKKSLDREPTQIPGKDFSPLRELTQEQAERKQAMNSQNITPTLGQVTRDPAQFRFEEQTAKKPEGAPLRTRELDTNDALIKAVEEVDKKRMGAKSTENRRQTGASVGNALAEKEKASRAAYSEMYEKARESGETKAPVDPKGLEKYLEETQYRRKTVTALDAIASQLDAMKQAKGKRGKLTVDDMEELYKTANELSNPNDRPTALAMKEIKKQINNATEGAGGDMYRQARKARVEHALEFEDRKAVSDLISNRTGSRTDAKTASEDVFNKVVVNSSLEELKDVTTSLLNGKHTSKEAYQAVRNLQGETIDYILEKGGVKGEELAKGVTNERGVPTINANAMREAVRSIGEDKLTELLGKEAVAELKKGIRNAANVKQAPGKATGSDAALALSDLKQHAMETAKGTMLSRIPGVKYIAPFIEERAKAKQTASKIENALYPSKPDPEVIKSKVQDARQKEKQYRMSEKNEMLQQAAPAAVAPVLKNREEE